MEVMLSLTRDEIQDEIPYQLICETRYGSRWNTGTRKRAFKNLFTPEESKRLDRLFALSHRWHLGSGLPDKIQISTQTLLLWKKLGEVCASI